MPASRAKPQPLDVLRNLWYRSPQNPPRISPVGAQPATACWSRQRRSASYSQHHCDNPATAGCAFWGRIWLTCPKTNAGNRQRQAGTGRPRGSPTRRQPHSRRPFFAAAEHGEDDTGKDGLKGYLRKVAREDVKAFSGLLGRVLPLDVNAAGTFNVIIAGDDAAPEALETLHANGKAERGSVGLCDGGEVLSRLRWVAIRQDVPDDLRDHHSDVEGPGSRHVVFRNDGVDAKQSIGNETVPAVIDLAFPGLVLKWNDQDGYYQAPNGSQPWLAGLKDKPGWTRFWARNLRRST